MLSDPRIYSSGSSAVGGIAGDILKKAFLLAAWACFRWGGGLEGVAAFIALPERVHGIRLTCCIRSTHDILL
jgi:hypothetical protein